MKHWPIWKDDLTLGNIATSAVFIVGTIVSTTLWYASTQNRFDKVEERVTSIETQLADIDKNGPSYAQKKNFDGRITKLETRVDAVDANGTTASQRSLQDAAIAQQNDRRISALESNMSQLLPAVKEIQVNTQWLMKQQGGGK